MPRDVNADPHGASPPAGVADAEALMDASLAKAPILDKGGYPYLIHPLLDGVPRASPDLLRGFCDWAERQNDVLAGATVLLGPEAMGLPLAAALSLRTGLPYLVIRKRQYELPGEAVAYCETGYSKACLYVNDVRPGDRVVLVDDVVSTGGTLDAILGTLAEMGAVVTGALVAVDKGTRLAVLAENHGVPILAWRTITVGPNGVTIVKAKTPSAK